MNIQALNFSMDVNGDGTISRWELWETVIWIYRLPGNLVVEGVGHIPFVSDLLGIHASQDAGYASLDGSLAVALSLLFWLAVVFLLVSLTSGDAPERKPEVRLLSWNPSHKAIPRKGHRAYH